MDCFSTSMIATQAINNSTAPLITENPIVFSDHNHKNLRRTSRTGLRNSDTWARKRALMQRGYQWTTTFEGVESANQNTKSLSDQQNSFSSPTTMLLNSRTEHTPIEILRRRRSSRRLPEIPSNNTSPSNNNNNESNISDEIIFTSSSYSSSEYPSQPIRENSLSNRSNRSKSIDSDSSLKTRSLHTKLLQTHQSQNAKSVDLSNLTRQKSSLVVNNNLLPQRSLDYPCIVRKAQDLSDIVRRRMLYSRISKQQGDNFSLSLEREHVPKVPRKIIIRQDNSIEIALR
jgi:hypothetical protein